MSERSDESPQEGTEAEQAAETKQGDEADSEAAGVEGSSASAPAGSAAGGTSPKAGAQKKPTQRKGTAAGGKSGGRRPDGRRGAAGRTPPEEFESVLSGRLVLATAFCLAMVLVPLSPLGRLIAKKAPESAARQEWKVGTKGTVHVTLVTADYDKLDCADKRRVGEFHCAFEDEKKPFPRAPDAPYDDNKLTVLQPYRTTDGQLLFLAGLWAQPEIAMRLHREPGRSVPEKRLARFVTECQVEFLEEWPDALYRWAPRDAFGKGETAMVARPIECHVFEGP